MKKAIKFSIITLLSVVLLFIILLLVCTREVSYEKLELPNKNRAFFVYEFNVQELYDSIKTSKNNLDKELNVRFPLQTELSYLETDTLKVDSLKMDPSKIDSLKTYLDKTGRNTAKYDFCIITGVIIQCMFQMKHR